jgi:hypothetical protein
LAFFQFTKYVYMCLLKFNLFLSYPKANIRFCNKIKGITELICNKVKGVIKFLCYKIKGLLFYMHLN